MKDVFKRLKDHRVAAILAVNIMGSLLSYARPIMIAYFICPPFDVEKGLKLLGAYAALIVVDQFLKYIKLAYIEKMWADIHKRLKDEYYGKYMQIPTQTLIQTPKEVLDKIVGSAISETQRIIFNFIPGIVSMAIGFYFVGTKIFDQSKLLGITFLVMIAAAIFINYKLAIKLKNARKVYIDKDKELSAKARDYLNQLLTVKKLSIVDFVIKTTNTIYECTMKSYIEYKKVSFKNGTIVECMMYLLLFIMLGNVIWQMQYGKIDGIFYFTLYILTFDKIKSEVSSVNGMVEDYNNYLIAAQDANKLFSSIEVKNDAPHNWKEILATDLNFEYESNKVAISIPTFNLKTGEKVSLMGESGTGKTTFLRVLAGYLNLGNGSFKIVESNNELKFIPDTEYIAQEMHLFLDSIKTNMLLGADISEETLNTLFNDAGLLEWIENLPEGYDTKIEEFANNISEGQKMRLKFIRGILRNKSTYLLDEPTANLDAESRQRIINMIQKYMSEKTVVISTHDPELKKLCSRHYVVDSNGVIEEAA